MGRYAPALSATAGFVFALFLSREILSLALGCFPGQRWLWRLSYAFGYELLPFLTVMRVQLGEVTWATCLLLFGLIMISGMAYKSKSLFLSAVVIHSAALSVWFCWLVSVTRHAAVYASADISLFALKFASQSALSPILTMMAGGLLLACLPSHTIYVGALLVAAGRTQWFRRYAD